MSLRDDVLNYLKTHGGEYHDPIGHAITELGAVMGLKPEVIRGAVTGLVERGDVVLTKPSLRKVTKIAVVSKPGEDDLDPELQSTPPAPSDGIDYEQLADALLLKALEAVKSSADVAEWRQLADEADQAHLETAEALRRISLQYEQAEERITALQTELERTHHALAEERDRADNAERLCKGLQEQLIEIQNRRRNGSGQRIADRIDPAVAAKLRSLAK